MEKETRMKPVSELTLHEKPEVVNLSLINARIKIEDLENKLAFSSIRIAQCEKENCDLYAIIEKLYENFINKPLYNMIDKLESNLLLLLNETGGDIEQSVSNDESANVKSDGKIIIDDQQSVENGSQRRVDIMNSIPVDDSSVSSDCKSVADDEDSIENKVNIFNADLLPKIKESLKRIHHGIVVDRIHETMADYEGNGNVKPDLKCDEEIFIISGEDDSNQSDDCPVSRPMVPAVIELDDLSSQSDAEDCLVVSDNSNNANDSRINQRKRNAFSGTFQKPSPDDDDLCVVLDMSDNSNSNITTNSKIDQLRDKSPNSLQKSTSIESDNPSIVVDDEDCLLQSSRSAYSNIKQKTTLCNVLQKSSFAELDDLSTASSVTPESVTCSKINQKNSFSGVLQKLNPVKFDDSSIVIGAEVDLSQSNYSNGAEYSAKQKIIPPAEDSQNLTIAVLGDSSSTQLCNKELEAFSDNSNNSRLEPEQEKPSFDVCNLLTESTLSVNSPQNADSNHSTYSRSKKHKVLDSFKKRELKEDPDAEHETNALKRAKFDLRSSCSSLSSLLFSPHSTSSLDELKIKRVPVSVWPCPVCDESFTNPYNYSKHLNKNHVGDEGVYTCSICCFVCASITGHKRHINKYHSEAFLLDNRFQYEHHLIYKDHNYARR